MAELADALDLGSSGATCGGSNPPSRTILIDGSLSALRFLFDNNVVISQSSTNS